MIMLFIKGNDMTLTILENFHIAWRHIHFQGRFFFWSDKIIDLFSWLSKCYWI